MASPGTPSSGNGGSSSNGHNSSGQQYSGKRESSSSRQQKCLSVRIQPTIGPSFALSLPASTKITTLKESISDKMGLSPQKMTLLLHNNALDSGTLTENGIVDGTEVRLVPAIESGVTTANSVDPVAMMKHSMSGISDQQIDDFLNGKFPLSVAIRVGESVVVVNLHRAKVEEIEMEPPPHKKRCVRARRPSNHDSDVDYLDSTTSSPSSSSSSSSKHHHHHHHHHHVSPNYRYLNSNHSSSELMRTGSYPTSSGSSSSSHRISRRKSHRSLGKGQDILSESRHHHRSHPSSSSSSSSYQTDRSMLAYTRDLPGAPMETSVAISAPPPMEGPSHAPIPRTTPIISKDAPVLTPIAAPPHCEEVVETKTIAHKEHDCGVTSYSTEEAMDVSSSEEPPKPSPEESNGGTDAPSHSSNSTLQPSAISTVAMPSSGQPTSSSCAPSAPIGAHQHLQHHHHHHYSDGCCPGHERPHKSISRSVQTDSSEPKSEGKEARKESKGMPAAATAAAPTRSSSHRKDGKVVSRREIKLPDSGISMKRKAVMEAISEILKKMYANTEKGRLPGSFKGRFSSEFTCDSDMREILHSKTTMTSYGSEGDDHGKAGSGEARNSNAQGNGNASLSKAKLEEQQQLKDKVANLKWQMQHKRALKMARRKGERSPCGWMEALNCDMPANEPKTINRSGFAGMKRGFLLMD